MHTRKGRGPNREVSVMGTGRLLTVQECEQLSGESRYTWRQRAYRGLVASVKMDGPKSRLLIPLSEVERLVQQGMRPRINS